MTLELAVITRVVGFAVVFCIGIQTVGFVRTVPGLTTDSSYRGRTDDKIKKSCSRLSLIKHIYMYLQLENRYEFFTLRNFLCCRHKPVRGHSLLALRHRLYTRRTIYIPAHSFRQGVQNSQARTL